jgi:hypothetical protein
VGGLSKAIVVLVAGIAVATIITSVMSIGVVSDAEDFLDGEITDQTFEDAIGPLSGVQTMVSVLTVGTAVVTMIWMYRIAANLRRADRSTTWNPLFAVFGWILPPILFVIPFLMLRELWKASDLSAGAERWRSSGENVALWAWFVVFGVLPTVVAAVQIESLASRGLPAGDLESVAEGIRDSGSIGMVSGVLNVAAAIAWILVVRQLTERHATFTGEQRG